MLSDPRYRVWRRNAVAFFWPKKGFVRGWLYLLFRILRIRSSDYALATGLACGVFATFTPFLGFHFIIAASLAWLMGGNIIIGLIGTSFGNPWTFPFIWAGSYAAGVRLMGIEGVAANIGNLSLDLLMNSPGTVLVSMLVGGIVLGLPVSLLFFVLGYFFAGRFRSLLVALKWRRLRRMKLKRDREHV